MCQEPNVTAYAILQYITGLPSLMLALIYWYTCTIRCPLRQPCRRVLVQPVQQGASPIMN